MADVRQDMVKRAVVFLRHPKVVDAPREKQIAFLRDKALTSEEIDEALARAAKLAAEASAKANAPPPANTRRLHIGPVRSEVVIAHGMVYVSGQAGLRARGEKEGNATSDDQNIEEETTQALEKVRRLLEKAGSSTSKVVSTILYVRDAECDSEGVDAAWSRWIDKDNPPARTVVRMAGVGAVGTEDGARIVVQATAHL